MNKYKGKGKRILNYFLQMLNQFIPVILGVYLGIVASNWNEERVRLKEQSEFINNLALEIEVNKVKVEEAVAYRNSIFLTAQQLKDELNPERLNANFWESDHWNQITGWEGFKVPTLESSVYQSGLMTNALQGLEFSTINVIARSYNHNDDYKLLIQKLIIDMLTQLPRDVKTIEVLNSIEYWHDVIAIEKELLNQYELTLQELYNYEVR